MANNRLTQESPHLNPDVFLDIRLFFIKYVNIVWKIICCKTLLQIGRRGMSAVFDTLLVFSFCELVQRLLFSILIGKCLASDKI